MKRWMFSIVLILVSFLFISCSNDENPNNTNTTHEINSEPTLGTFIIGITYPLDEEYMNTLENSNESNVEFVNITNEYAYKWKEKMDYYYAYLHDNLDDNDRLALEEAQHKWEEYTLSNDQLIQSIIESYGSGTIVPIILAKNEIVKYRTRAVELLTQANTIGSIEP